MKQFDDGHETSIRLERSLMRLPSVWEEQQEVDEDGILRTFYINVETGDVKARGPPAALLARLPAVGATRSRRHGPLPLAAQMADDDLQETSRLLDKLDDYRGKGAPPHPRSARLSAVPLMDLASHDPGTADRMTGAEDWGGAVPDDDDGYTYDLDIDCDILAKRFGSGGYPGSSMRDENDEYAPDDSSDPLGLLGRRLRQGGGKGAAADADDGYSPEALAAALKQLEEEVSKNRRRFGLRVSKDGDDDIRPEAAAALELVRRGLRAAAQDPADGPPDMDAITAGLNALKLLKRKMGGAKGAQPDRDSGADGMDGEDYDGFELQPSAIPARRKGTAKPVRANSDDFGAMEDTVARTLSLLRQRREKKGLAPLDADDELMLDMNDLITRRREAKRRGKGSVAVKRDTDDDAMLVEAMNGLIAQRRAQKRKLGAGAAPDAMDEYALAEEIAGLLEERRAKPKASGAVPRNENDTALIDGLSDLVTARRAKGPGPVVRSNDDDSHELADAMADVIAQRRAARQKLKGSGTDEDDEALVLDAMAGLIDRQKVKRQPTSSAATGANENDEHELMEAMSGLIAKRKARPRGSTLPSEDDILDAMSGVVEPYRAKRKGGAGAARDANDAFALAEEVVDLLSKRQAKQKESPAVSRSEDDAMLIDGLADLVAARRRVKAAATAADAADSHSLVAEIMALVEARQAKQRASPAVARDAGTALSPGRAPLALATPYHCCASPGPCCTRLPLVQTMRCFWTAGAIWWRRGARRSAAPHPCRRTRRTSGCKR